MKYRIEKDTMGEVKVPNEKLWGAQTERSRKNFKIGKPASMPIEIIYGFAYLKKAAAHANHKLSVLDKDKRDYISKVCDEILTGQHNDQFPLVIWQTGSVFNKRNAAAAAVAAHECGHAVQHAKAYSWLQLRSAMVPVTSVVSRLSTIVIFIGIAMYFGARLGLGYWVVLLGFLMMGISTLFCFITLPVEYDASRRALAWLKNRNMVSRDEYAAAEDALRWAARTYLVAALGALATLMYWVMQFFGRR
jgi:Zn-dependent membrane protease YugP